MKRNLSKMNTNQLRDLAIILGADRKKLYGCSKQSIILTILELEKNQKQGDLNMKATDLVVGKIYWCGWASCHARFVRIKKHTWCGKTSLVAVFRDVCDCLIECDVEYLDRWVEEAK